MLQILQGNICQPWNKREDKTVLRCQWYRYYKVISTNLGTREKTRLSQMSMIQILQGNIYQPWNQREDKTFIRCPCYRYHKVISTNLGTREKTRRLSDINDTDTTRQYLSTLEPERRQDVYQMFMLQILQGNIYQSWNQREDKTFLRCQWFRYHKAIYINLGTRERTRRLSDVNDSDTTRQ